MEVTTAVVRVYGTNDQYGDAPRTCPPGSPIVLRDFPSLGATARVELGAVPDDVVDAERGRRALIRAMVLSMVGENGSKTPNEKFSDALRQVGEESLFEELNWYCTIVISRHIEVPEEEADIDFVFPREAFKIAEEAQGYAKRPLDVLATIASTVIDRRVFAELVLDDRVLLFAQGKRAAGVPVVSGGMEAQVKRGAESIHRLATRVTTFRQIVPKKLAGEEWLSSVARSHAQVLGQMDPLKQFLWSFTALETLTHKLFERFRDDVIARLQYANGEATLRVPADLLVGAPERAPLVQRFAFVAIALYPETSTGDTSRFRELKEARDALAHGTLRGESELPVAHALDLQAKYVAGALKKLVLGIAPTADPEAPTEGTQQP